jgi:hypothetical protein
MGHQLLSGRLMNSTMSIAMMENADIRRIVNVGN